MLKKRESKKKKKEDNLGINGSSEYVLKNAFGGNPKKKKPLKTTNVIIEELSH